MNNCIRATLKFIMIVILIIFCSILVACKNSSDGTIKDIKHLSNEEFTYYADNICSYADELNNKGIKFLYVQLPLDNENEKISEVSEANANSNADGMISMISNDYHDVIDFRNDIDKKATNTILKVADKIKNGDLDKSEIILIIGDEAGKKFAKEIKNFFKKNYSDKILFEFLPNDKYSYDKMAEYVYKNNFNMVIIANDTLAFAEHNFPYAE